MIYLWAGLASVLVIVCEALFKATGSYWRWVWLFVPLALVINYAIFRLVVLSPSLPAAFVTFSLSNILLRTAVSGAMGHSMGRGTWTAIGLMLLAAVVRHRWS